MWETISKILNVILGTLTTYFYFENRKLKKFKTEKQLTIKKAELSKLNSDYWNKIMNGSFCIGSFSDPIKEAREYNYKKICLKAEIKELKKILENYK